MPPLSAIDAISPAFRLTHHLLLRPFRIGRSWKLAVTQYLGLMGAIFVPLPLALAFLPVPLAHDPHLRLVLYAAIAVFMLVLLAMFYIGVRLQFVNLEMIITRQVFITPMWRRHSAKVWPVVGLKIAVGTVLYLAMLPIVWKQTKELMAFTLTLPGQTGQQSDPQLVFELISRFATFYALLLLAFLGFKVISTLFEDFALPFYALEPISLPEALRRGVRVLIAEPLQCLIYLVMKFLLSIAGFMAQYVANLLVLIPFFLVFGIAIGIGAAIQALTHGPHPTVSAILLILGALLYITLIVAMFWYQVGGFGYIFTVLEAYSVLFLAGRYPHLAMLLRPSPQPTLAPPPPRPTLT